LTNLLNLVPRVPIAPDSYRDGIAKTHANLDPNDLPVIRARMDSNSIKPLGISGEQKERKTTDL